MCCPLLSCPTFVRICARAQNEVDAPERVRIHVSCGNVSRLALCSVLTPSWHLALCAVSFMQLKFLLVQVQRVPYSHSGGCGAAAPSLTLRDGIVQVAAAEAGMLYERRRGSC